VVADLRTPRRGRTRTQRSAPPRPDHPLWTGPEFLFTSGAYQRDPATRGPPMRGVPAGASFYMAVIPFLPRILFLPFWTRPWHVPCARSPLSLVARCITVVFAGRLIETRLCSLRRGTYLVGQDSGATICVLLAAHPIVMCRMLVPPT